MKKTILMVLSSIVLVTSIVIYNYIDEKTKYYKSKVKEMNNNFTFVDDVVKTNKWIKTEVIPHISTMDDKENTERKLLETIDVLKEKFKATVQALDKTNKGYMKVPCSCKIYKNSVEELVELYKLKIPNGYIYVKSLNVQKNKVEIFFDMIVFYKGDA